MKTPVKFGLILLVLVVFGLAWWQTNPTAAFAVLAVLTILGFVYKKVAQWGDDAVGKPDPRGVAHREKMQRDAKRKVEP